MLSCSLQIEDCAVAAPAESHDSKAVVQEVKRLSRPTSYAEHKVGRYAIIRMLAFLNLLPLFPYAQSM
jgi:hypothetical protein